MFFSEPVICGVMGERWRVGSCGERQRRRVFGREREGGRRGVPVSTAQSLKNERNKLDLAWLGLAFELVWLSLVQVGLA